jgi:hypothetical protein
MSIANASTKLAISRAQACFGTQSLKRRVHFFLSSFQFFLSGFQFLFFGFDLVSSGFLGGDSSF